jgi:hypothetical protein
LKQEIIGKQAREQSEEALRRSIEDGRLLKAQMENKVKAEQEKRLLEEKARKEREAELEKIQKKLEEEKAA